MRLRYRLRKEGKRKQAVRVTEVLGFFKEQWYIDWVVKVGKREANRVSKEALKLGSILDEIIKKDLVVPPDAKPDTVFAYEAFTKWRNAYQPTYIRPCERLYANIDGIEVTGEPDFETPGVTVDLKGAARISTFYKIQVNVYEFLRRLNNLPMNENVGILRCDKKIGGYEYWQAPYNKTFVDAWLGMAKAYVVIKGDGSDGVDVREEWGKQEVEGADVLRVRGTEDWEVGTV